MPFTNNRLRIRETIPVIVAANIMILFIKKLLWLISECGIATTTIQEHPAIRWYDARVLVSSKLYSKK